MSETINRSETMNKECFKDFPYFETDRLRIRPFQETDMQRKDYGT